GPWTLMRNPVSNDDHLDADRTRCSGRSGEICGTETTVSERRVSCVKLKWLPAGASMRDSRSSAPFRSNRPSGAHAPDRAEAPGDGPFSRTHVAPQGTDRLFPTRHPASLPPSVGAALVD